MPYIESKERREYGAYENPRDPGELNFAITKCLIGRTYDLGLSYQTFHRIRADLDYAIEQLRTGNVVDSHEVYSRDFVDTIHRICHKYIFSAVYTKSIDGPAAIELAWSEYHRRVVVPYEARKQIKNGDVYPKELTGGG